MQLAKPEAVPASLTSIRRARQAAADIFWTTTTSLKRHGFDAALSTRKLAKHAQLYWQNGKWSRN